MSLNLPKTTEINRFVAKANFYKQAGITPKLHDLIETQIDRIAWTAKVAPTTMNISSNKTTEFQSFTIQLKSHELDNSVLLFIQKSVPYPIIFIIKGGRGCRAVAVISGVACPVVMSTEWQPNVSLEPRGNSTDALYKNYLFQISPNLARVRGDIEKYSEMTRLKKSIGTLKMKSKKETQINRRQDIARECYKLELKLKDLLA